MSQLELQQSIQRFTGEFLDGVAQSLESAWPALDAKQQQIGLQRMLLYGSSALDIASGPQPEINVLDMLVFVSLSRQSLESHWIPEVLGEPGRDLVARFATSEQKLWALSDMIMSSAQQQELREIISAWRAGHPTQVRVEWVRLQDFAGRAGEVAEQRAASARGLLGGVKVAAQTADQALLLAERGMFLAQRWPFMLRLQARIGVRETLDDSLRQLDQVQALVNTVPRLAPVMRDAAELSSKAESAAREGRLLFQELQPLLQSLELIRHEPGSAQGRARINLEEVQRLLEDSNRLADRSVSLLQEMRGLVASGQALNAKLDSSLDRTIRRWLVYLLLLGAAWTALFWGGYYVAKRSVQRAATAQPAVQSDDAPRH